MRHAFSGRRAARRPAHYAVLALVAGVLSLLPSAAHAGWSRPQVVGRNPGGIVRWVGIDGHGTSYAVWDVQHDPAFGGTGSLRMRVRPSGGHWQRQTVLLSKASFQLQSAIVAPDGTLTVLWSSPAPDHYHPEYPSTLHASTRYPDGGWSETLVGGVSAITSTAVDRRGDLIVAWSSLTGVHAAIRPAGGPWGPAELVWGQPDPRTFPPTPVVVGVQVGLSDSGQAVVAWRTVPGSDPTTCQGQCGLLSSDRNPDGTWAQPTTLSTTADDYYSSFSFAEGRNGDSAIAWYDSAAHTVQAALRSAGSGSWSSPDVLDQADWAPQTAVGPAGTATVLWTKGSTVYAATHPTSGTWTRTEVGTALGGGQLVLASARNGTLAAIWQHGARGNVSMRSATGSWTSPQKVSSPGVVGVAPDGRSVVGTAGVVDGRGVPEVTSYDAAGPHFSRLRVPTRAHSGQRLAFWASPRSWLPETITWHFGDHHRARGIDAQHRYRNVGTYHLRVTIRDNSGSTHTAHRTIHVTR